MATTRGGRMEIMEQILSMLCATQLDRDNYNDRKVAEQVKLENGLKISSCYTSDRGYETAIGYNDEWYPVERYADKDDCVQGHSKWTEWAKNNPKTIPYIKYDSDEILENIEVEYDK